MDFTVANGSIYSPQNEIIEDLSFILTMDKDDESIVSMHHVGDHETITNDSLPRISLMSGVVHIICFTFADDFTTQTALTKEDQVTIVNFMRNVSASSKTASVAQAIYRNDADGLKTAFDAILAVSK